MSGYVFFHIRGMFMIQTPCNQTRRFRQLEPSQWQPFHKDGTCIELNFTPESIVGYRPPDQYLTSVFNQCNQCLYSSTIDYEAQPPMVKHNYRPCSTTTDCNTQLSYVLLNPCLYSSCIDCDTQLSSLMHDRSSHSSTTHCILHPMLWDSTSYQKGYNDQLPIVILPTSSEEIDRHDKDDRIVQECIHDNKYTSMVHDDIPQIRQIVQQSNCQFSRHIECPVVNQISDQYNNHVSRRQTSKHSKVQQTRNYANAKRLEMQIYIRCVGVLIDVGL